MAGPFDFLGYGGPAGAADSGLGGMPSFLAPSGSPSLDASVYLAAALGGFPISSAQPRYSGAMGLAQQFLQPAPSAPDPWAGARPISLSDLGLLPLQPPSAAAVPSAPPAQGYGEAMMLAQQLLRAAPSAPDPWAGAHPISPSDLGLLPMQRPATAAVPGMPAATAENFGWLGLPGAPGLSPYDASAAPRVTAENFGWQGPAQALGSAPAPVPVPALPMGTGLFPGLSTPPGVASGVSAGNNSATAGPGSSLAVIFGGNRGGSGNPLGHIAIAVEGRGVYSFGTKTPLASSATDYVNSQKSQRDVTVVTVPRTPEQSKAALDYLQQYKNPQGIGYFDNCANRTGTALMRAGILPDPGLLTFPPYPSNVLFQARGAAGASEISIPKNGSPPDLTRFDPRP